MNELNNQVIAEFRANNGVVRDALGGASTTFTYCFFATSEGAAAKNM
jgi:hypothetical protein